MLKDSRLNNQDYIDPSNYHVSEKDVDIFCRTASLLEKRGNINKALENYVSALKNCPYNNLDKAVVLRRFANTVVKGNASLEEKGAIAKIYLQKSIEIHEKKINSSTPENKIECLEYQRCLNSLCLIASDLRDGELLEKTAKKLLSLARQTKNYRFVFDALNYLYMVDFSLNKLQSAQERVDESIVIAKEHKIEYSTCYRHLAKINLLKGAPADEILTIFWSCYDGHKKLEPSENRTRLLIDDLKFLFVLRIYQFPDLNIYAVLSYIEKEAKQVEFSENETEILKKNLQKKSLSLERGVAIPLCHSFFSESKQLRPHFSISVLKNDAFFKEYEYTLKLFKEVHMDSKGGIEISDPQKTKRPRGRRHGKRRKESQAKQQEKQKKLMEEDRERRSRFNAVRNPALEGQEWSAVFSHQS